MNQYFTKTKKELEQILKSEIDKINGNICILAGHFALIHDKNTNEAIPAIFEDIKDKEQKNVVKMHPYMGYLPFTTLKEGASLIKYANKEKKDAKILFIVNDWQWMEKSEENEENLFRERFYKESKLPVSYQKEFKKNKLGDDAIMPFKNEQGEIINKLFFSEKRLRNQFSKHFALTCPVGHGCAQEYVPMLSKMEKENIKLFIGFIPKTCQIAVNEGAYKFKETYKSDMKIVNIFVNGIYNKDFYEEIETEII